MSEDKMQEAYSLRFGTDMAEPGEFRFDAQIGYEAGWVDCAAIKDAEIAQLLTTDVERGDLITELYKEIASRDLTIQDYAEYAEHKQSCAKFDYGGAGNVYEAATCTCGLDALAKSEHHNSRALEIKLLEAELRGMKRAYGISMAEVDSWLYGTEAKLAELNKG